MPPAMPLLVLFVFSGCALLPAARGVDGAEPPAVSCPGTDGQQVLDLVNGIRERHGLSAFTVDGRLVEAALRHSRDQAGGGRMEHIGSDGSTPGERVEEAGYHWTTVSENVGAGYASASAIVAAWMASPPHRATILSPSPVDAGVGYVLHAADPLRHFWTLDVAAPRPGLVSRSIPCHP